MDKGIISLVVLIEYFDTYNRSEGRSPFTLRWYRQSLTVFLDWLAETGRSLALGSISEDIVREFILYLRERTNHGRKLAVQTINSRVRALRAFFNWLYQRDYTDSHLLQDLRPPSPPKLLVVILSDDEIAAIFAVLGQLTMTESRNRAIIALLLDSGLRLSELTDLRLHDVHLEDQYVKVMGKGSKERIVAFGSAARKALLHYLIHFRGEPVHPGIEQFFLTIDGHPMSREAIKSMLRRTGETAGVSRLHAHLCRHTYATNFLINGGNVLLLKQNLGHTTLIMVDRYVHLATSKVALLSRNYSPLDKLNIRGLRRGGNRDKKSSISGLKVFRRHPPT